MELKTKQKKRLRKVYVEGKSLLELIHWARRYADMRSTWVPNDFNQIYDQIMAQYPFLKEHDFHDKALHCEGKNFPYATNGIASENERDYTSVCF